MAEVLSEPDERVRQVKVRLMTREILEKAPLIYLPTPYVYTGWWPWVKNSYGAWGWGGYYTPNDQLQYIWLDQSLKKSIGY